VAWHLCWRVFAGLAYLTNAAVPPIVLLFVAAFTCREVVRLMRGGAIRRFLTRGGAAPAMVATFLAIVSPYILTNKRDYGEYFFDQTRRSTSGSTTASTWAPS
jgi:hypothetical protein